MRGSKAFTLSTLEAPPESPLSTGTDSSTLSSTGTDDSTLGAGGTGTTFAGTSATEYSTEAAPEYS